jgi:L-fuconolactonase
VIDAHVHLWDERRRSTYDWMTDDMAAIRRPFGLEDLRPHAVAHGVEGVVLVQTCSRLDETQDFLVLAATDPLVAGVVGWVDLADPAVPDRLAELRSLPGGSRLVGVRHQVHDEPDPDWLLREDVRRGLRAVEEAGLTYDLLVRTRELPAVLETALAFPELRLVIDHLAKPPVAAGLLEEWAEQMAQFAALEHVACKLSGLVTEADWSGWAPDDLVPYVARVADWFGEDRLLFGSDWPVCLLAASYDDVVVACEHALGDLPLATRTRIFETNARRIYALAT